MDRLKIQANYRSDMSKSHMKKIRREGYVTGTVYGRGADPIAVEVLLDDVVREAKTADAGAKALIDLKVKGAPHKSDGIVIIKEFFKDPLSRRVLDIQFQRVNLKEKINVGVPVELVGESPGVKDGGILEQVTDEIQISCLPTDIPPRFEVDVSGLEIGMNISVGQLVVADEIDILTDSETTVCTCRPPHVAHVEEAVAAEESESAPEEAEGAQQTEGEQSE